MDADDLQVLHSAHNLLEVLDVAKKRRPGAGEFLSPDKASLAAPGDVCIPCT